MGTETVGAIGHGAQYEAAARTEVFKAALAGELEFSAAQIQEKVFRQKRPVELQNEIEVLKPGSKERDDKGSADKGSADSLEQSDKIKDKIRSTSWSRYDWSKAVKRIWAEDGEFQEVMVRHILQNIRNVKDDEMLERELVSARKDGLFYCPNDDYMADWLGEHSVDLFAGIYRPNGLCRYTQRLVIPIYNFAGEIPGFIGYSNDEIPGYDEDVFVKYTYPPKETISKGRFMYITAEEYAKAVKDEYICIVDGIFDKRRLTDYGYNAVSLMGSAVTFWHKLYLSKIKHLVVIRDNDEAGYKLLQTLRYNFPGTIEIAQGDEWDIDDFLKTPENLKRFGEAFERVRRQGFLLSEAIRKPLLSRKENLANAERRKRREAEEAARAANEQESDNEEQ